jgi:hypothetical protein
MENGMGKKKDQRTRRTYHAHGLKIKNENAHLEHFFQSLIVSGQKITEALFKLRIKLEEFKKMLKEKT